MKIEIRFLTVGLDNKYFFLSSWVNCHFLKYICMQQKQHANKVFTITLEFRSLLYGEAGHLHRGLLIRQNEKDILATD